MDDATIDMIAAQGLPVLERYFGIWPTLAADAVWSVCAAYQTAFGKAPTCWSEVDGEIDQPDIQAAIAYYRAKGPYDRRKGTGESVELPPALPEAKPVMPPLIMLEPKPVEAPLPVPGVTGPRIEGLACERRERQALLNDLLVAAPANIPPPTAGSKLRVIDLAIRAIADAAVRHKVTKVDVYLPHRNPSEMFKHLVMCWMHDIRPEYPGVRLWFHHVNHAPQAAA